MSGISLTDEDLRILYGTSAKAAFTAAVASCFLKLAERRDGEELQDFLLKELQGNLKRASSPNACHPMPEADLIELRQYYRLFLGFYRHPSRLENFASGARHWI